MKNPDQFMRDFVSIQSLRMNLPELFEVEQSWVANFHTKVESIEQAQEMDLAEFRVPDEHIQQSIGSFNSISGQATYRDGLWCKRDVLVQKVDALIGYLSLLNQKESGDQGKIGYQD